jgi:hypothetical protein
MKLNLLIFVFIVSSIGFGSNLFSQASLPHSRTVWDSGEPAGWSNSGCSPRLTTFACTGSNATIFDTDGDSRTLNFIGTPDQLTFKLKRASMSGASALTVQESADGVSWNTIGTYGTAGGATTITDCDDIVLGLNSSTRYIRWTYAKATGNCDMDDVSVTPLGTTPTITVSPSTLTNLNYVFDNGPSTPQSFTISGINLTNNIILTAPTNYEISLTIGFGYTNSIVLNQIAGNVANTTIYVQLKAGLAVGTYNAEIITATSTGASPESVTCSGSVTLTADPTVPTTLFEIENILVDACAGTVEGQNEMVIFQIGPNNINVADLRVDGAGATGVIEIGKWPNTSNNWLGIAPPPANAADITWINSTITNCGLLIEPIGGIIPAGKKVLMITSTDWNATAHSFVSLQDTLYIIFQNAGNTSGHFVNHGTSTERTFVITHVPSAYSDIVKYDRSLLVTQAGVPGAEDGGAVEYTWSGVPTYYNNGCQAPFIPLDPSWSFSSGTICETDPAINLSSLVTGTLGGTWSGIGVTGTSFSPSGLNGSINITHTVGTAPCTATEMHSITVNINTTPTFTALGPYCVGDTPASLSTTSTNGINGTWSPATISTAAAGTTVYTFTPTAGQCAIVTTMSISVNATSILPTFTALGPYCVGATPAALTGTSTNGITGTWSPATISTATAGTTIYTFTPTAGQCATTTTMSVTVNSNITPTFTALGPYCVGATPAALSGTSTNGISGTWSPATISTATAGTTIYTFTPTAGQCATTTTMSVTVNSNITPTFTALGPYCVGATPAALSGTSTNGISGTWSPATISTATAGTTIYTFTPTAGQCATTTTMSVTVNSNITPTFTALGPYCVGATPAALSGTSTNGISGTWSPATISTATAGTTIYTFTPTAGQCATTTTMSVTVNSNITPTFTALGPYCVGATPAALSGTSTNGITGTWSPATISTATAGTTIYTFTPTAGQCATTATLTIIIDPMPDPTINPVGPFCITDAATTLTAATAGGTWAGPGVVGNTFDPSLAGAGTHNIIFTVSSGGAGSTVVWAEDFGTGCNQGQLANGFDAGNGAWSVSSTGANDVEANLFFVSATEQIGAGNCGTGCGGTNDRTLHVGNAAIPLFGIPSDGGASYNAGGLCGSFFCVETNIRAESPVINLTGESSIELIFDYIEFGDAVNDNAELWYFDGAVWALLVDLPKTSCCGGPCGGNQGSFTSYSINLPASADNNANVKIGFNWTNNDDGVGTDPSFAVDNIELITTNPGTCVAVDNINIVVNPELTPTFTALGPYCVGATPAALSGTSTNGISGTWSPATISTAAAGTTIYTFTPTAGQCATTTTMSVTVNSNITPTFTALGPYCVGAMPAALSATSTNGITGTWSPATISTATAGTTIYTFTPTAGQCATTTTMSVIVDDNLLPTFTALGPYCVGATPAALSATSTNGITGTWSPATISTATAGTTIYTFTPTAGQCATTATMSVTVDDNILPTFTALGPYCVGATPAALSATSTNGITGTWSPASISTAAAGTTVYTFTPTAGQCATTATMSVTIDDNLLPTFTALGPYCVGATPAALSGTSTNGITGTWSPATISTAAAGTTIYTFTPTAGQCATTTTMSVTIDDNILPTFTALGPFCVGATPAALSATSTNGITGTWSPATISTATAGTTIYTFTPTAGQCATTTTMSVTVDDNILPTFTALGPYCVGATPAALSATSTNGITGTWSPATISTAAAGTTVYTFTPTAGQCATTATMSVTIDDNILPTFTALGPYCVGATPAALSATSTNGITGTWAPATISTAASGTTIYTFTPTAGQCATTTTMSITVDDNLLPTFTALGPYCVGATPAALSATSTNGITGTWSPATISTAAAGTTIYTFTPTAGQCATTATMSVTVDDNLLPTFTALGPYCVGATPAALSATSTNGITGTWAPATISTAASGTTIYTFTPTAGQCATTTTMSITVDDNLLPTFTALGPYCVGATPAALSGTSTNGINGTWSPATISTATAGTTVYTFTPTAGQCATTTTMSVTIDDNLLPTFTALGPYCVGATPAALSATSTNGITGTWSPATISTAAAGTTVYTFTPTAGQCATTTTMSVIVDDNLLPTFTALGPYCVGATPAALSATSTNGITGTWSPATISTATAGTTIYTFTPTAGQCATTTTMSVTIDDNILPTFTALGPYCVGATPAALSATSTNGITGTWSPASISTAAAGTTVYTFTPTAGQCATTTTMSVTIDDNTLPTFTALGPYCVGAMPAALSGTSTNGITGTWSPATISTAAAGTTVYTFTPTAGQCATTTTMSVIVDDNLLPTFTALGPYCVGATPAALSATSTNGITGTWSPATISTAAAGTTVYTFTPTAGQCATTTTMSVIVDDNLLPTFTALGPYCVGATPAALSATSTNGITGTWSPATISTAAAGTTIYTFTPTAGQCATTATMSVTIDDNILPTFTALGPYCVGATPAALSATSTNGITGTWAPATISTAASGTTIYTFTPTAGQCATTTTMSITVDDNLLPTFTALGPYCVGATPAALSATSTNGITGTWSPATISTAAAGTTVYTFTPTAGQCATTATMSVTVDDNLLPTFTALGPYCVGATPAALSATSTNGITGTWSPATISTAAAGTTIYTFTPTAGQCATTATMSVTVDDNLLPTFTALGPYCVGATPAALSGTSDNGITGTWSPASISTAAAGTTVYTFTPTAGQCATTATMSVTVDDNLLPTFTALGPYCVGATPAALSATSTNGITGTWSPATISTAAAGTTIYTFTPTAGQCATTTTMSVIVDDNLLPTFTALGPYCVGATPAALSATSTNGITGTWSPATISTAAAGTTVYTFTPTAGQCATTTTMSVTIEDNILPTFTALGPYCVGATSDALSGTSNNGITGTWSPATISTATAGTTVYTFTPTAGQCATTTTMSVIVDDNILPTFTALGPYCVGATSDALSGTSDNGITGTWSPATISTATAGTTVYTFTPTAGQCATTATMSVTIDDNLLPTFTALGPYCVGATPAALSGTSTNGITGTWSPATISTATAGTTVYTFTPTAGQCATTTTMSVTIDDNLLPTFTALGPYCVGATPAALSATSTNGITGTWSPATISTAAAGTTIYTFTPTAGQCATTATMSVTVDDNLLPTFTALGPYCVGATPAALSATSTNGITGTWSPATISTAAAGTTIYTFTPTAGQCATTATMSVTVDDNLLPTFTALGPYCVGATPAALSGTSDNGITGTWSPASISTAAAGTTVYTFTPTAGQCATTATMSVTVDDNLLPTFTALGPYCVGATPAALSATSTNGITGTWSPATISTAAAGTTIYTFTPTAGQCATTATMSVTVDDNLLPTFTALGPYCVGATPAALSGTSDNGITGTWSPASISTAAAGTTVYTFTPTAGQCATTATMSVTVDDNLLPTFTALGPYCVGATPAALSATSTNGITGTWSPASISTAAAGTTVYTFTPTAGQCATTTTMSITVDDNLLPTFTALGPYCVGATPAALSATSTNGITGTWSPATISTAAAGTTIYTFTPTAGQCATTATMSVTVDDNLLPTFTALGPYCVGATPAALSGTSDNGITGTWSAATISTATAGTTVYTFTPTAGQCATTTTMSVIVDDNLLPTFTALGPYCVGATPAALSATSTNGITGTWSPATISTAAAGTTVYTFTPTAGQCATTTTMSVIVDDNLLPTFTALGPYCVGATPAALSATSTNGITGTWSPATISTATAGTTIYTFTPTAGQCATTTTMSVTIDDNLLPTFTALGPYCVGATPAALSATSTNGITGTWSPATISTAAAGTTIYTFTPTAGQCATTATMSVTVDDNLLPTFTALGPYCVGATPAALSATSTNGITGTWSPATISTAAAGTTIYTFTPTAGQCATTATMSVTIDDNILPTFTALGPYCVGATPAALSGTSDNGITGTWSAATISTATAGTTVYTFTPTAGQCATTTTMSVIVDDNLLPTFTALGPYCVGATPAALSGTSTNGITGTWSPATISTAAAGTTVYTFTPTAGQCATTATMSVTIDDNILPTFTALGPYCVGATPAALSATSTIGITGTWSPASISTAAAGTTVYTFTPTAGQCATTTTMSVTIDDNTLPTFTALGPYCVGATPAALSATSTNGITGTWSPATISTAAAGTTVYTFTPTAGQCATTTTMSVIVDDNLLPTFTALGPYCVGATPAALSGTSTNGITGTWSPATISTAAAGTTVYTFTPTAGQCATTTTMSVTIDDNLLPTFTALGPYCVGAAPAALSATSTNGITGTWSPATISTAAAGTTVYTFTPTAGQCATTTTMSVIVDDNLLPTFTALGPYCVGATPAALSATSTNGITGTWSPATISTAASGTTVYTFTPDAIYACTINIC